ncbi:MAG: hypothetical protein MK371_07970 [SAR86 cluster bacterium]|jgi:hypothetical protein|nr:hypothetical protein [SAR86 cluster bacterium]|tara:strand:+ start:237 stop:494 length:258 start_codon:yes stop_codon:yes gene_type:complete
MAHAHKGKKKVSKAMGAILKAPKKVEKVVETVAKYVNKTHWDTKEAFAAAIDASGINPNAINVNSEWDFYQSDKDGYKNHLKLEN